MLCLLEFQKRFGVNKWLGRVDNSAATSVVIPAVPDNSIKPLIRFSPHSSSLRRLKKSKLNEKSDKSLLLGDSWYCVWVYLCRGEGMAKRITGRRTVVLCKSMVPFPRLKYQTPTPSSAHASKTASILYKCGCIFTTRMSTNTKPWLFPTWNTRNKKIGWFVLFLF